MSTFLLLEVRDLPLGRGLLSVPNKLLLLLLLLVGGSSPNNPLLADDVLDDVLGLVSSPHKPAAADVIADLAFP